MNANQGYMGENDTAVTLIDRLKRRRDAVKSQLENQSRLANELAQLERMIAAFYPPDMPARGGPEDR